LVLSLAVTGLQTPTEGKGSEKLDKGEVLMWLRKEARQWLQLL